MNFDQRSAELNTELGLIIDNPVMARQLDSLADAGESAYQLRLSADGEDLEWVEDDGDGNQKVYREPPETTAWQRFMFHVLSPFVPKSSCDIPAPRLFGGCSSGLILEMGMTTFETTQNVRALSTPAVLHMVCGKIGAGKSTLTKSLAAEPMTVLICEDDWLARLYPNEIHVIADYARCAGRLREAMAGHIQTLLTAGMSVVLDFPSNTTSTRAWARSVFEKAGASHVLHFLDVSDGSARPAYVLTTPPENTPLKRRRRSSTKSPVISLRQRRTRALTSYATVERTGAGPAGHGSLVSEGRMRPIADILRRGSASLPQAVGKGRITVPIPLLSTTSPHHWKWLPECGYWQAMQSSFARSGFGPIPIPQSQRC